MDDQDSRLLTLPRELRDIIYEFTFLQEIDMTPEKADLASRNAGLLLTCRRTYDEARELYLKRTIFTVHDAKACRKFLASLHAHTRRAIRTILIQDPCDACRMVEKKVLESRTNLGILKATRDCFTSNLRFIDFWVARDGLWLQEGMILTKVLSWNGKENIEIWSASPMHEEMPRL